MKTIILFITAVMISFSSVANTGSTQSIQNQAGQSESFEKPGPAYNKKKRAKQVRKMRAKATKNHKRSGGDMTQFNCRR